MLFHRLTAPMRDGRPVEDALAALCDAAGPRQHGSAEAAAAAVAVLSKLGVDASVVPVGTLVMNRVANSRVAAGDNLQTLMAQSRTRPRSPDSAWLAHSGSAAHHVVRCGGWLLDLAVDDYAAPDAGFSPSPLLVQVPDDFWAGSEAVFLAGDDGSSIWMWVIAGGGTPPDPATVHNLVDVWTVAAAPGQ